MLAEHTSDLFLSIESACAVRRLSGYRWRTDDPADVGMSHLKPTKRVTLFLPAARMASFATPRSRKRIRQTRDLDWSVSVKSALRITATTSPHDGL